MGGDNNNVEFQVQMASQVSLHSIQKEKTELEIFSNDLWAPAKQSRVPARAQELEAAALAHTDCFTLEQNV